MRKGAVVHDFAACGNQVFCVEEGAWVDNCDIGNRILFCEFFTSHAASILCFGDWRGGG